MLSPWKREGVSDTVPDELGSSRDAQRQAESEELDPQSQLVYESSAGHANRFENVGFGVRMWWAWLV